MLSKILSGSREVEEGTGGQIHADGRTFDLGGEHTMQYTDDVLMKYILETHIILFFLYFLIKFFFSVTVHIQYYFSF